MGLKYVAWSGGFDSTLVLHDVAQQFKEDKIIACSISVSQIAPRQRRIESERRAAIEKELISRGLTNITYETINLGFTKSAFVTSGGLPQAALWATMMGLIGYNQVYFGYCKGDEFWRYYASFWHTLTELTKMLNKQVELQFPLECLDKHLILGRLKHLGLFRLPWCCELPVGEKRCRPCGTCASCARHKQALYWLETLEREKPKKLREVERNIIN